MITKYLNLLERLFIDMNFEAAVARNMAETVSILSLLVVSFLLFWLVKWLLKNVVGSLIRLSATKYDDFFLGRNWKDE